MDLVDPEEFLLLSTKQDIDLVFKSVGVEVQGFEASGNFIHLLAELLRELGFQGRKGL